MNPIPPEEKMSQRAIDELVQANIKSNETMKALVAHVRKETEARDRKIEVMERSQQTMRLLVFVCTCASLLLVVVAGINAVNINRQSRIAEQVKSTNSTLLDCLNSTGECGRANAQQQKIVLDKVKQYELTGFYCIRVNPGTADPKGVGFLACMKRLYPDGPTLSGR